ncbi:hypothetical protein L1987_53522 [Smallanthus sonchifolius]|uniref:Uncharacterized protein n=1 Tax=Smallanthus sonchifolius TaxID=185202 RepID=A0ACB9EW56_9ASTR|nr:hypothetical protein L1987_53522 [Smallanthus sonchifolius]
MMNGPPLVCCSYGVSWSRGISRLVAARVNTMHAILILQFSAILCATESSWCLEELAYIMKCNDKRGLTVMPIFYDVAPSEVRKQEGEFGRGFAKQEVGNINKVESLRKALIDASEIAGWEPKNIANGSEHGARHGFDLPRENDMIEAIQYYPDHHDHDHSSLFLLELYDMKNILYTPNFYGLPCLQKLTLTKCSELQEIHSSLGCHTSVEYVSVFFCYKLKKFPKIIQMGKLKTLKIEYCNNTLEFPEIQSNMERLVKLSLRHVRIDVLLSSIGERCANLISLELVYCSSLNSIEVDFDGLKHLEVFTLYGLNQLKPRDQLCISWLVGKVGCGKDWYKSQPSIRLMEHVMSDTDSEDDVVWEESDNGNHTWVWYVSFGSLRHTAWWDETNNVLSFSINSSFSGFGVRLVARKNVCGPIETSTHSDEESYYTPKYWFLQDSAHALEISFKKVLRQKALITIMDDKFDMHDLVQEMGHYIVRGEYPNNPEKHSRVWKCEEIINMFFGDATMEKENDMIEAIQYYPDHHDHDHSSLFCKIVSNMKKLRYLSVTIPNKKYGGDGPNFLSNELRYMRWKNYPESPFPDTFQPMKLVDLKLSKSLQKELWKGYKHLPPLKVLELYDMKNILCTPNFYGLPCLQKLTLTKCSELQEIHSSLGCHTSVEYVSVFFCYKLKKFPKIVQMGKLETLKIEYCNNTLEFPEIQSNMERLVKLSLRHVRIDVLLSSIGERCANLISLELVYCSSLNSIEVDFDGLKHLEVFTLYGLNQLKPRDQLCISWLVGKGNAIEDHSMVLRLQGLEIAKEFVPPLVRRSKYTLKLPENWCNDFSGFLMCFVSKRKFLLWYHVNLRMEHVMSDTDSEDDVVWEESDNGNHTWVWYVSFGSLRHTAWWDETNNVLSFSINSSFSGFGVRLVARKNVCGPIETSTHSDEESYYTPKYWFLQDSAHALEISFKKVF